MKSQMMILWLSAVVLTGWVIWGVGQENKPPEESAKMKVAVMEYWAVGLRYGLSETLGLTLANAVSTQLSRLGPFEVYERIRLDTLTKELQIGQSGLIDPETAAQVGKAKGVQYVVYGEVESASCPVERNSYKDKKGNIYVSYSAEAQVVVHHVITEVEKGKKWKETRLMGKASGTYDEYPSDATIKSLCVAACEKTAVAFGRLCMPRLEGQVIAKTDRYVIVNLGRKHYLRDDVDIRFFRPKEVRDQSGETIKDPTSGEPLRTKEPVQAIARKGHDKPSPCVGRPVQIEESHCLTEVGYYGKEGLGALKFKTSDSCFAAVQKGDVAVVFPQLIGIE